MNSYEYVKWNFHRNNIVARWHLAFKFHVQDEEEKPERIKMTTLIWIAEKERERAGAVAFV